MHDACPVRLYLQRKEDAKFDKGRGLGVIRFMLTKESRRVGQWTLAFPLFGRSSRRLEKGELEPSRTSSASGWFLLGALAQMVLEEHESLHVRSCARFHSAKPEPSFLTAVAAIGPAGS